MLLLQNQGHFQVMLKSISLPAGLYEPITASDAVGMKKFLISG